MAFTLRWKNENPAGSIVKIYRGTAKIDPKALPAPIVTLSNNETEWTDETVILNTRYWYLLTVTVNGRTVASPQKSIVIKNRRGVGGVDQINYSDTDDLAFLGQLPFEEQMTYDALPAGFRALTGISGTGTLIMNKFYRHGKVYYMMNNGGRFNSTLYSWNDIYNAGLVYGVDGFGPDNGRGDLAGVDQSGLFEWQGDTYRMRLLRGLTDGDEPTVMTLDESLRNADHDDLEYGRCEYNDFVYPFGDCIPNKQMLPNWTNISPASIYGSGSAYQGKGFLCQERDPESGLVLVRGSAPIDSSITNTSKRNLSQVTLIDSAEKVGLYAFVIELVE
ncbi:hypothetical protein G3C84_000113 [Salmonella enterica]|nr:hypothetical protein [Salmonella enterica]